MRVEDSRRLEYRVLEKDEKYENPTGTDNDSDKEAEDLEIRSFDASSIDPVKGRINNEDEDSDNETTDRRKNKRKKGEHNNNEDDNWTRQDVEEDDETLGGFIVDDEEEEEEEEFDDYDDVEMEEHE